MRKFLALLVLLLATLPLRALTPNQAVRAALADADTLAHEDQPFIRYTYLPLPPEKADYDNFTAAQKLSFNLNSREVQFAYGKEIAPGVWRLDLRDYQWSPKQGVNWENFSLIDPYFHRNETVTLEETVTEDYYEWWPGGYWSDGCYYYPNAFQVQRQRQKKVRRQKTQRFLYVPQGAAQLDSLASLLDSNAPIVRADWALVQMAQEVSLNDKQTKAGYYDFLQVNSLKDYLKLIGSLNDQSNVIQAIVTKSGVTKKGRKVIREGAQYGGHWFTQEVVDESGKGIPIQELRINDLNFAASEHFGFLPNSLPATFLNNAQGVRQDVVPPEIAGDKSPSNLSNDLQVAVNKSCLGCHAGNVLQPFACDIRKVYTGKLHTLSNDKNLSLELQRQYGPDLDRALARDRNIYQDAIVLVTGSKTAEKAIETYMKAFNDYSYTDLTVDTIANEQGVTGLQLQKALADRNVRLGTADFRFDPWIAPHPGKVPRLIVEDAYQDIQDAVYGILRENKNR